MEGPEKIWEEGEIAAKSREEGEKGKLGVGRIELGGRGLGNKKQGGARNWLRKQGEGRLTPLLLPPQNALKEPKKFDPAVTCAQLQK